MQRGKDLVLGDLKGPIRSRSPLMTCDISGVNGLIWMGELKLDWENLDCGQT